MVVSSLLVAWTGVAGVLHDNIIVVIVAIHLIVATCSNIPTTVAAAYSDSIPFVL